MVVVAAAVGGGSGVVGVVAAVGGGVGVVVVVAVLVGSCCCGIAMSKLKIVFSHAVGICLAGIEDALAPNNVDMRPAFKL